MKKKGYQKIIFRPYNMNQLSLPMSLDSLIPPQHQEKARLFFNFKQFYENWRSL